jgi:hypothetical protein
MNHKIFKRMNKELLRQAPPRPKEYKFTFQYDRLLLKTMKRAKEIYSRMPHNEKNVEIAVRQAFKLHGR